MDDFFIQEEVIVKTEGVLDEDEVYAKDGILHEEEVEIPYTKSEEISGHNGYVESSEQFLLDGAYNRELMVYLKCPDEPTRTIKKESYNSPYNHDLDEGPDGFPKLTIEERRFKKSSKSKKRTTNYEIKRNSPEKKKVIAFECTICMFSSPMEEELKGHMLEHIDGPDAETFIEESLVGDSYRCFFCPFSTRITEVFADHLKHTHSNNRVPSMHHHQKENQYSESDYDENSDSSADSKSAIKRGCHSCPHCSFSTKSLNKYNSHLSLHSDREDIKITRQKPTKSNIPQPKISLENYKPSYDKDGRRYYPCSYCDYRGSHRFRIIRHERIHTGEKPFACQYCSFRCNQEGTLKIHIRRHTGERPYHCRTCSFKTISRASLNTHERIHNRGNQSHVCGECGLGFASARALARHEKQHLNNGTSGPSFQPKRKKSSVDVPKFPAATTTITPPSTVTIGSYKCSLCNFRCNKFLELSEHTQMHKTGGVKELELKSKQKPKYQCSACGFKCARKKELRGHIKIVHDVHKKQEAKGMTIKIGGYIVNVTELKN